MYHLYIIVSLPSDEIQSQISKDDFFKSRIEIALLHHYNIINLETKKNVIK